MLPREIFEILHAVMAILVLFEHFSGKFCLNIFGPNSEYFTKCDAFSSHIFNYSCLRRKAYCYRRGSKLWKICIYEQHS